MKRKLGREVIAITHLTLDGVMQGPGGPEEDPSGGFTDGGWAMPFGDEASKRAIDEIIASDFELLLGRRTYDIFAGYWPQHDDDPIGRAFNRARKHVATRRPGPLGWRNSERLGGDIVEEVRRLKSSDGPPVHIWGSGELLQTLMAAGLIGEHRLWIFPVVLGKGKRLFEKGSPPRSLALVATGSTPRGVLFATYRPAGAIPRE